MQKKAFQQFLIAALFSAVFGSIVFCLARTRLLSGLWLPSVLVLVLLLLPALAQWVVPSMLKGLFDLDLSPNRRWPVRVYFVSLAAYCVAATAYVTARLILLLGPERFGVSMLCLCPPILRLLHPSLDWGSAVLVLAVLDGICIPLIAYAIAVSHGQDPRRSLVVMIFGAVLALASADASTWLFIVAGRPVVAWLAASAAGMWLAELLGRGYEGALSYHVQAALAAMASLLLYGGLGIFGYRALGKRPTVAAIIGPLMAAMVFGWLGQSVIFFLGRWSTPVLLVVIVGALLAKYFHGADHTYEMVDRSPQPLPEPYEVLAANSRRCAVLVAAAGGGIQAAAWTTQVLMGLRSLVGLGFDKALCALSGISGGSVGSACYVHWLANPSVARDPVKAASGSSLDEVAWGLAWPDLIRLFVPGLARKLADRAGAMERAWVGNASLSRSHVGSPFWNALSSWNDRVGRGELPALFMGSTMVESGEPLILGTSDVNSAAVNRPSSGWMEGDQLHRIGNRPMDIPIVRGARLSAAFPYVTPAARPRLADQQPHMVDGGFFDNYGTATLIEWLDQALEEQDKRGNTDTGVNRILLIQTLGFPKDKSNLPDAEDSHQGWPFQLYAPVEALVNVRTAGQISHRGIEIELLQQKWARRGVEIQLSDFVCNFGDAPLSWHLMPKQKAAIANAWSGAFDTSEASILREIERVKSFLASC